MSLISVIQQVDVNEKIKHAPNSGYLIGVWIGYLIPFTFFALIAYWIYSKAKKRQNEE
jgi:hypothetical protein